MKEGANPFYINKNNNNLSPLKASLTRCKCPVIDTFFYLLKLLTEKGQDEYMEQCKKIVTEVEYEDKKNSLINCGKNKLFHILSSKSKTNSVTTWNNLIELFGSHTLIEENENKEIPLEIILKNNKIPKMLRNFICVETIKEYKRLFNSYKNNKTNSVTTWNKLIEENEEKEIPLEITLKKNNIPDTLRNYICVETIKEYKRVFNTSKNNIRDTNDSNIASTSNENRIQKRKFDNNNEQPNPKNRKISETNQTAATSASENKNIELELSFAELDQATATATTASKSKDNIYYKQKDNKVVNIYKSNNEIIGSIVKEHPMTKSSNNKNINTFLYIYTKNNTFKYELLGHPENNVFYIYNKDKIGELKLNGNIIITDYEDILNDVLRNPSLNADLEEFFNFEKYYDPKNTQH